jgi:hypothetical protein
MSSPARGHGCQRSPAPQSSLLAVAYQPLTASRAQRCADDTVRPGGDSAASSQHRIRGVATPRPTAALTALLASQLAGLPACKAKGGARLLSMPDAIAAASPERRAEIVGLLVDRVTATRTTGMMGLEWTAPAAPFFRRVLSEGRVGFEPTTRGLKVPCSNR